MKILITGAAGQVGREVADLCQRSGIDHLGVTSAQLNITDAVEVEKVFHSYKPTVVINCAAYTAVDLAEDESEQAYLVNEAGPRHLALACVKHDALMLHISTDYVFDGEQDAPYGIHDAPCPTGVYGASKLAGEKAIQETSAKHMILRVSWVFGQYGNNFVKTMLRLAEQRSELSVVADQFGAPTPAAEIARVLVERAQDLRPEAPVGIQHLESNPGVSWCDFAREIFRVADAEVTVNAITSDQYPTKATRPKNSKLRSNCFSVEWQGALGDNITAVRRL